MTCVRVCASVLSVIAYCTQDSTTYAAVVLHMSPFCVCTRISENSDETDRDRLRLSFHVFSVCVMISYAMRSDKLLNLFCRPFVQLWNTKFETEARNRFPNLTM